LLTGQIDVENPDKNYRFSNIKSTATCKHHMQEMQVMTMGVYGVKAPWQPRHFEFPEPLGFLR